MLFLPGGSAHGAMPQVMVAAAVAEAGHSLMWLDLDGRKQYGMRIGWEGAVALARDPGPDADPEAVAYALALRKNQLSLYVHRRDGTYDVLFRHRLDGDYSRESGISLAVFDRRAALSLPLDGRVLFVDAARGKQIAAWEAPHPKGLLTDGAGHLFVVEDRTVTRYAAGWPDRREGSPVVTSGLDDPRALALDAAGNLYVSDWGASHQVKMFGADGALRRALGAAGGPQQGRYDERRMHHPSGLALDDRGRLWVAELDYVPKRLSLWTTDGAFVRAFYGPPRYGGGGVLDPADSTRFFHATGGDRIRGGLTFALDWHAGTTRPDVIYRRGDRTGDEQTLPYDAPVQPIRVGGRTYLVNTFNQAFHGMRGVVGIWLWEDGAARLVAAAGFHGRNENHRWTALDRPELAAHRPATVPRKQLFFVWSDLDLDGLVQPEEVQYAASERGPGRVGVGEGLTILTSWLHTLDAPALGADGVPRYDLATWTTLADAGPQGAGDVLKTDDGWVIRAGGPILGFYQGTPRWQYHSPYFDRAASPGPPARPGELAETSRVLGPAVYPPEGEAGAVWGLGSDQGAIYLFTADGLFLGELGGDVRAVPPLRRAAAAPGEVVEGFSFDEEHFYPTLTQLQGSGTLYLAAGKGYTVLFRVEGLGTVRRLDAGTVTVGDAPPAAPLTHRETATPEPPAPLTLALRDAAPRLDGDLSDWDAADWAEIDDRRGLQAALAIAGDTLYAAFRAGDPALLRNDAAEGLHMLFATGGGLDLMIQPPPPRGKKPKKRGAVRLVVTRTGDPLTGPVRAARYQAKGGDAPGEAAVYTSPIGDVRLAGVADVSARVRLAQRGGDYELAVPLDLVGLVPADGLALRGDVGVLLGDGGETTARVYWSNKTHTTVSDVPSEARLNPKHWGPWIVRRR